MITLPELVAEFVMALGGALAGANLWVLLRPVVRPGRPAPGYNPSRGRAVVNILIGLVVFTWGLASFVTS